MFPSLSARPAQVALAAVVAAGALALTTPAFATDYCVQLNPCAGTPKANLEDALSAAAIAPDADRIFLGEATYTAPVSTGYHYQNVDGPVEIIGAGVTKTTLTSPAGGSYNVLFLDGGSGTLVRDLTVQIPANVATDITGLTTTGTARDIVVRDDPSDTGFTVGVSLSGGVLEHSFVDFNYGHGSDGVILDNPGGTLRDSSITGRTGVQSSSGGTIERSLITGDQYGVAASRGVTTVQSTIIQTFNHSGATCIFTTGHAGSDTKVVLDGVTLEGSNFGTAISADTAQAPADNVDVDVDNSIILGYPTVFEADASGAGAARIAASYSDYSGVNHSGGANAHVTEANISHIGAAGLDPYLVPLSSSALVDAGDPATPQGLDVNGQPLVTDGNGDGVARRDIGAHELPGPLPGDVGTPAPVPAPPAAALPSVAVTTPADTLAPRITGFRASRRAFIARRGTRLRYTISEAARVVVEIRRARTGRRVGRLTRIAKLGLNRVRLSGRIGRKQLKPGRYRAVIIATDAAGNRSAPRRLSLRVVRSG